MIKEYFENHSNVTAGITLKPFGNCSTSHLFTEYEKQEALERRTSLLTITSCNTLFTASLVHGDTILDPNQSPISEPADALITNKQKQLIGVTTADCIPVFVYSPEKQAVGIIHSGRAGVLLKIVPKTIKKMEQNYGIDARKVFVHIGPHICSQCYEVDNNILEEFGINNVGHEKGFLDMKNILINDLKKIGVVNISSDDICTHCSGRDIFFSYRNQDIRDRMISFIGLI